MKRIVFIIAVLLLPFTLSGCKKEAVFYQRDIFAMDTLISFKIENCENAAEAVKDAIELIHSLEAELSISNEDSAVFAFNESETGTAMPEASNGIIRLALEVSELTGGRYDISVAPLVKLWDIKSRTAPPSDAEINDALKKVDYGRLAFSDGILKKADPDLQIDLGSIGKGYALDKVVSLLKERGVGFGIVSFGGNVGVFGEKPDQSLWKVAVKHPRNSGEYIGGFSLAEGFVAVSGDYERFFEYNGSRYCHIIDPLTGRADCGEFMSVAVACDDGTAADALSTALFVAGNDSAVLESLKDRFNFSAVFFGSDGVSLFESDKSKNSFSFEEIK